jgi:membrane-associated phospholipid phosphatase
MKPPLRAHANARIQTRRLGLALGVALIAAPLEAQASDEAATPPPAEAPPSTEANTTTTTSTQSAPVESRPASGDVACPPCATAAPPPSTIRWRDEWPRVTLWEHTLAALAGAGALAALQIPPTDTGRWQNGFDEGIRSALRVESASGRTAAAVSSDFIFYGLMLYPIVVDTLLVGGARDAETSWQMTVLNLQSLAIAGATSILLPRLTGRERPFVRECAADPEYDVDCDNPAQQTASFTSGHTLMAFAGAGLVCAHHLHLPLYGGGLPDTLTCAAALALANAEGFLRISADVHYATDVIAGGAIGFGIGYLIPRLLHYRSPGSAPASVSFAPYAGGDAAGIAAMGTF